MKNYDLYKMIPAIDAEHLKNLIQHYELATISFTHNNFEFDQSKLPTEESLDDSMDEYFNRLSFLEICAELSSVVQKSEHLLLKLVNGKAEISVI